MTDSANRRAVVTRVTGETDITVELDLDGTGTCLIDTGVPFFDHMLNAFGRHGLFDLTVRATKAAGRAMRYACELDPRVNGVPSTKGSL